MTKMIEMNEAARKVVIECLNFGATVRREENDIIFEKDEKVLVISLREDRYLAGAVISKETFQRLLSEREEHNKESRFLPFRLGWEAYESHEGLGNHDWNAWEAIYTFKQQLGIR